MPTFKALVGREAAESRWSRAESPYGRGPVSLVVFDLDGTLIDSRRDLADSANLLVEEHGGRRLEQDAIVEMIGEGVDLLVRRALAAAGVEPTPPGASSRFKEIYAGRLLLHTRLYPCIPEALSEARRLARLAVLSNKPRAASREILEGLGIAAFFDEVYGGDAPFPRKPDPQGLLRLARDLGNGPAGTLLVGDSPIDLQTARAAAVRPCVARYGFGFARIAAGTLHGDELFIDDPREVVHLLKSLGSGHLAGRG